MHQDEKDSIKTVTLVNTGGSKNCCGKCAGKNNSQHAHCGKSYIIREGVLEETSITMASAAEEFNSEIK